MFPYMQMSKELYEVFSGTRGHTERFEGCCWAMSEDDALDNVLGVDRGNMDCFARKSGTI